jgi:hypothetical protein
MIVNPSDEIDVLVLESQEHQHGGTEVSDGLGDAATS